MRAYVKEVEFIKNQIKLNSIGSIAIQTELELKRLEDSILSVERMINDSLDMITYLYEDSLWQIQQLINDSLKRGQTKLLNVQQSERYKSNRTRIEVMRSFKVKQMGIFNCHRFNKRPILETKKIIMLVNDQARQFDTAYLVDVKSNAVLNYLKYSVNNYLIDLDLTIYVLIGILGGEIYITKLSINELTKEVNVVAVRHIDVSELKEMLN